MRTRRDPLTEERAELVRAVGLAPERGVRYRLSTAELRRMVRSGRRIRVGRDIQRDPSKPFQVGKTYEVITPESAEHGDAEERGWVFGAEPMTLRETMREIGKLGAFEPDSSPVPRKGTRWTLYETDGDVNYRTGAETRNALHIRAPENAMRRLKQLLADEFRLEGSGRDPLRREPNDYVVINYHDVGSRIVRGPVRVRSATEAIEKAVETPHSSIEVHDPNGWVLRTLVFSPKHPIDRSTLNKLLMRS